MNISVKNLGPIKSGDLNLDKELIILTGPNNTGKSYITYLIHGISLYEVFTSVKSNIDTVTKFFEESAHLNEILSKGESVDVTKSVNDSSSFVSNLLTNITKDNLARIFASSALDPEITIDVNNLAIHTEQGYYKRLQIIKNELIGTLQDNTSEKVRVKGIMLRIIQKQRTG